MSPIRYLSAKLRKWFWRGWSFVPTRTRPARLGLAFCLLLSLAGFPEAKGASWDDGHLSMQLKKGERTALEMRLETAIRKLNPAVPEVRAEELSRLLVALSPRPRISVGILMQESGFRDVHTGTWGVDAKGRQVFTIRDLGIAQINWETALEFGCDVKKLAAHDLRESVRCHSVVLREKIRLCKNVATGSWGCYHSRTSSLRQKYYKAVMRHLHRVGLDK